MANTTNIAYEQKYFDDFIHLSQQRGSRLEGTVRRDPDELKGKAGYFDRLGATAMVRNVGRNNDTPNIDVPHSRRRIVLDDYDWATMLGRGDLARMMKNPKSAYVKNGVMASARQKDDLIIAALGGNAYSMDADDAASTVALPAAQKVLVQSAGFTLAKLLEANEVLLGADPDEEEPRYALFSAKQLTNMLNTTEVKSADYNAVKALVEGRIDTFMGYKFIRTERLQTDSSSNRLCYIYLESACGIAVDKSDTEDMEGVDNLYVSISKRNDKRDNWQVYINLLMDATRIEDEKVVQIACSE